MSDHRVYGNDKIQAQNDRGGIRNVARFAQWPLYFETRCFDEVGRSLLELKAHESDAAERNERKKLRDWHALEPSAMKCLSALPNDSDGRSRRSSKALAPSLHKLRSDGQVRNIVGKRCALEKEDPRQRKERSVYIECGQRIVSADDHVCSCGVSHQ
jgi:hypothetical protein